MKFIDILAREVANSDRIYLYHEANSWCAYEQSACRLNQLMDNCPIEKVISLPYEVVLIRITLTENLLNFNGDNTLFACVHGLRLRKEGYLEIPLPRQSETLFNQWKEARLAETQQVVELEMI